MTFVPTPRLEAQLERQIRGWLLAIAMTLCLSHLYLVHKSQYPSLLSASCLFWAATMVWFYQHRHRLQVNENRTNLFAFVPLSWLLFRSLQVFDADYFLRLYPLLSLLSLAILASGIQGLSQYRQAFLLLSFLLIPWDLLYLLNMTEITTQFAATLLRTLGLSVQQQGFVIALPNGAIEVYNGCSGVRAIAQLVGLAWIYLCFSSTHRCVRSALLLGAVVLGFGVNGLRVALLAVLSGLPNDEALHYWHQGTGSLVFSMLAVVLFGLFLRGMTHKPQGECTR